jgi:hypothetical protein
VVFFQALDTSRPGLPVTRAVVRSIAAAGLTGAVLLAASWIDFAFCARHRTWVRHEQGSTEPIIRDGYLVARPRDAIFVCRTEHRFEGWLPHHDDLACYCAPASMSAADVGHQLGGECSIDQLQPSRTDERGACLHARCDDLLTELVNW